MKAPDKIYLNKAEVEIPSDIIVGMAYARPNNGFVPIEYIRKDALLEWLEQKKKYTMTDLVRKTYINVIDKLNSF